jgi:hypothetical protein
MRGNLARQRGARVNHEWVFDEFFPAFLFLLRHL